MYPSKHTWTSGLSCSKTLPIKIYQIIVLLDSMHVQSWGHAQFDGFCHPENKVRSIIFLTREAIFISFPWHFRLRAQYCFLSVRISYLNVITLVSSFLWSECVSSALFSQIITVCWQCWVPYCQQFPLSCQQSLALKATEQGLALQLFHT